MKSATQTARLLAARVGEHLSAKSMTMTTAESCTGGAVAETMTALPGSSSWFERGFVSYSNAAKVEMLKVRPLTLAKHGAVSEPVVMEMATGALQQSHAHWALAISGIAGPGGGTAEKPVGTICFAWLGRSAAVVTETRYFKGDRQSIRDAAVIHALEGLWACLLNELRD